MPIISKFPSGSGLGSGIAVGDAFVVKKIAASGRVYIKWRDPNNIVSNGAMLATWAGTKLVRKVGSAPKNHRDGTTVVDSTIHNRYSNDYFCDSGLTDGVVYYYKLFPYTDNKVYTETGSAFTVIPTAEVSGVDAWMVKKMYASQEAGNGKMAISWEDPSSSISLDGLTLTNWFRTTVVIKENGYAENAHDSDAIRVLTIYDYNRYVISPLVVDGLVNGTTYYVSFFPETTDGYINVDPSQRISGAANRITIEVPTQRGSLTYNGDNQRPQWNNYDSSQMIIGGRMFAVNAGNYDASFEPAEDYRWSNGSTGVIYVRWTIHKATGSINLGKSSVTLTKDDAADVVSITRSGTGTISVSLSHGGVANAYILDDNVHIVGIGNGSVTVTVSVGADMNFTAASSSISVIVRFNAIASISPAAGVIYQSGVAGLDASTMSVFADAIAKNQDITNKTSVVYIDFNPVYRKISIGDQIVIPLNGVDYAFDIIGFNHDTLSSGISTYADWSGGDTGSVTPTTAGMTLQMHAIFETNYKMNSENTNVGGWKDSEMRTSTMPLMKSYMPSVWQNIIKTVDKVSGVGGSSCTTETTSDECFLLSYTEVDFVKATGSIKPSPIPEDFGYESCTAYAYYVAGNSSTKYKGSSIFCWWYRTPYGYSDMWFCCNGNGVGYTGASGKNGVSFAFCI